MVNCNLGITKQSPSSDQNKHISLPMDVFTICHFAIIKNLNIFPLFLVLM